MMVSTLVALLCFAPAAAMLRGTGHQRGKVQSDMRPEVVSQLLSKVEKSWIQGQVMVLRNITDDASSYKSMEGSCLKISSAIVAGSEGEKDRVVEYMQDVCGQAGSSGMCTEFASGVEGVMTDDESFNRDALDLKPFCKKFWDRTVSAAALAEKQKLDAEEAKKEEEQKKQEELEETARKAAEEAAAAKAKEEVKEAEEAKAYEAATKKQESQTTTTEEPKSSVEPAAEVPQANVTSAAAAEVPQQNVTSAVAEETVTTSGNASEPVAAAPAEEVKNMTAIDGAEAKEATTAEEEQQLKKEEEEVNATAPAKAEAALVVKKVVKNVTANASVQVSKSVTANSSKTNASKVAPVKA